MHQGRECGVGLDCGGVIEHVAKKIGVTYIDPVGYSVIPRPNIILDALSILSTEIREDESMPGDIVTMKIGHHDRVIHCGILSDYGVIHAVSRVGMVVETIIDQNPTYKIVGWRKFNE